MLTRPAGRPLIVRRRPPGVELRHGLRRRRRPPEPDRVVRVRFHPRGGEYCYLCRGASVGDYVEVDAPFAGVAILTVIGLGRNGYDGPLKRARLVR